MTVFSGNRHPPSCEYTRRDTGGNIACFQPAQQHVNHDAVGVQSFLRHSAQFLVRQVHRIARLKCNDRFPAALTNLVANFNSRLERALEIRLRNSCNSEPELARDAVSTGRLEDGDARVIGVQGAEHFLGNDVDFFRGEFLDALDIHHCQDRITVQIWIAERNSAAPRMPLISPVRFSMGTGQNNPSGVCIFEATLNASMRFMNPFNGVK